MNSGVRLLSRHLSFTVPGIGSCCCGSTATRRTRRCESIRSGDIRIVRLTPTPIDSTPPDTSTTRMLAPMEVPGRSSHTLRDVWGDAGAGAGARLGSIIPRLPEPLLSLRPE